MKQTTNRRPWLGRLAVVGVLALCSGLVVPAEAGHRQRFDARVHPPHRHHDHPSRHAGKRRPFRVPHRIRLRHAHRYAPYYSGRVYVPAHRHDHRVYRFPVLRGPRLVYRPHVYCGVNLVRAHPRAYRRHGVHIGFRYRYAD